MVRLHMGERPGRAITLAGLRQMRSRRTTRGVINYGAHAVPIRDSTVSVRLASIMSWVILAHNTSGAVPGQIPETNFAVGTGDRPRLISARRSLLVSALQWGRSIAAAHAFSCSIEESVFHNSPRNPRRRPSCLSRPSHEGIWDSGASGGRLYQLSSPRPIPVPWPL